MKCRQERAREMGARRKGADWSVGLSVISMGMPRCREKMRTEEGGKKGRIDVVVEGGRVQGVRVDEGKVNGR